MWVCLHYTPKGRPRCCLLNEWWVVMFHFPLHLFKVSSSEKRQTLHIQTQPKHVCVCVCVWCKDPAAAQCSSGQKWTEGSSDHQGFKTSFSHWKTFKFFGHDKFDLFPTTTMLFHLDLISSSHTRFCSPETAR